MREIVMAIQKHNIHMSYRKKKGVFGGGLPEFLKSMCFTDKLVLLRLECCYVVVGMFFTTCHSLRSYQIFKWHIWIISVIHFRWTIVRSDRYWTLFFILTLHDTFSFLCAK